MSDRGKGRRPEKDAKEIPTSFSGKRNKSDISKPAKTKDVTSARKKEKLEPMTVLKRSASSGDEAPRKKEKVVPPPSLATPGSGPLTLSPGLLAPLGALPVFLPVATTTTARTVNNDKWHDLSKEAQDGRFTAFRHQFTHGDQARSFDTFHKHGDFNTSLKPTGNADEFGTSTHNVATSSSTAKSMPKLIGEIGSDTTNTLRVLRGSHSTKQLEGTLDHAKNSVELAAEIGISEFSRGGTNAILNATSALYLVKHRKLAPEEFADPNKGFIGSGEGGAQRLRALSTKTPGFALHSTLSEVYQTHGSAKTGKAWSGPVSSENFAKWIEHKATKWTQRQ